MLDNTNSDNILKLLQDGIELKHSPYLKIANLLNIKEQEVIDTIKQLINEKKIRRFGASVNHKMLGYLYNAMLVMNIQDNNIQKFVSYICKFDEVSHCYERKRIIQKNINWNYNIFAMIHGRSRDECESIIKKIVQYGLINKNDYLVIYSIKELKKTGVRI